MDEFGRVEWWEERGYTAPPNLEELVRGRAVVEKVKARVFDAVCRGIDARKELDELTMQILAETVSAKPKKRRK